MADMVRAKITNRMVFFDKMLIEWRRNMKKFIVILGVLLLTMAAFSACGSNDSPMDGNVENLSTELTIATPWASGFLEAAARRFEDMYDGRYTVTIVVYDDVMTYGQVLNTAIMSGMGEDILDVWGVPWQRIADVGGLLDLNHLISFQSEEFYQGVLDAFLQDGRRYAVPLGFRIDAFRLHDVAEDYIVNPNRFTLEDIIALSNAHPDRSLITGPMGMSDVTLAHRFFNLYFEDFIDLHNRTANVDSEKFINLLLDVQLLSESIMGGDWSEALIQETVMHNPAMNAEGIVDNTGLNLFTNSRGEGIVVPSTLFAVNANASNPALAARFIQFLLSEEMQSSPEMFGTPVNRNAAVINGQGTWDGSLALGFVPDGVDFDTNLAVFNALANRLTLAGTSDPFIGGFVSDEMSRFFVGEITAEQAAANLQARLMMYLNE